MCSPICYCRRSRAGDGRSRYRDCRILGGCRAGAGRLNIHVLGCIWRQDGLCGYRSRGYDRLRRRFQWFGGERTRDRNRLRHLPRTPPPDQNASADQYQPRHAINQQRRPPRCARGQVVGLQSGGQPALSLLVGFSERIENVRHETNPSLAGVSATAPLGPSNWSSALKSAGQYRRWVSVRGHAEKFSRDLP